MPANFSTLPVKNTDHDCTTDEAKAKPVIIIWFGSGSHQKNGIMLYN